MRNTSVLLLQPRETRQFCRNIGLALPNEGKTLQAWLLARPCRDGFLSRSESHTKKGEGTVLLFGVGCQNSEENSAPGSQLAALSKVSACLCGFRPSGLSQGLNGLSKLLVLTLKQKRWRKEPPYVNNRNRAQSFLSLVFK